MILNKKELIEFLENCDDDKEIVAIEKVEVSENWKKYCKEHKNVELLKSNFDVYVIAILSR